MAQLATLVIAIAILFLLLIQSISLRIVYPAGYTLTLDYSFFAIVLRSRTKPRKKKRRRMRLHSLGGITRSARRLLGSTNITVNRIKIPGVSADPFKAAIAWGGASYGAYSILNVILPLAKSTFIAPDALSFSPIQSDGAPAVDIIFETELYNVLLSGIILLYEELKGRITRNVRQSYK